MTGGGAPTRVGVSTPVPVITQFRQRIEQERGLHFATQEELHAWSVDDQAAFWSALFRFEEVQSPTPHSAVLVGAQMPDVRWFPGAQVNYARHVFAHVDRALAAGQPAIIAEDETGTVVATDWIALRREVAALALRLRAAGVVRGDRVAAYLPNRTEAIVAFLASASIGAIWTVCAPDMGAGAVLSRFQQIEPKVLIACDAVRFAGKVIDRRPVVTELLSGLPSLAATLIVRSGLVPIGDELPDFALGAAQITEEVEAFEPDWLPFDQPLWIVYSSGTTGKPKALVHGHGGVLLGALATRLHMDLGASYAPDTFGERFHWYSSTGWIMWNCQLAGLLSGTTICLYDGSAGGSRDAPDWGVLWRFAARHGVTFFGAGAAFFTQCARLPLDLAGVGDLSRLRALGSTASPLPAEVQIGLSRALDRVGVPEIWWLNISGGTDICGAFCTGSRELPPAPGKLQCRQLGAAVEAWDEQGRPRIDSVGELVCTKPLPSMPLFLWNDPDGSRYRESYFDMFEGVWRHGDWLRIEPDGVCEIFGRSDATINRGGHRLGTSEIYDAIETLPQVLDSMAVDVRCGTDSSLLLFVVVGGGKVTPALRAEITAVVRTRLSPRFVPDEIIGVSQIPRTLSMKKQELPTKRLLEGVAPEQAFDFAAMLNPEVVPELTAYRPVGS